MNKYRIHFIGLVCHVGKDPINKNVAALVRDDEHTAGIIMNNKYYEIEDADRIRFVINGELQNEDYRAVTDVAFNKYVPSVKSIMDGTIESNLASVAVIVHYPPGHDKDGDRRAGNLSVSRLYHDFGRHHIGGDIKRPTERVAKQIVLEIETPYPELEVVKIKGNNVATLDKIGPNGCMLIGNVANDDWDFLKNYVANQVRTDAMSRHDRTHTPTHDHGKKHGAKAHVDNGHFRKFGKLLNGENDAVSVDQVENREPEVPATVMCWVDLLMQALDDVGATVATHVECGNTDYP